MEEALLGGRCRLCAKNKSWRVKAVASTPALPNPKCPRCGAARKWEKSYCPPCDREYMRGWRKRRRAQLKDLREQQERTRKHAMRGVDIDAIHYKLGAVRRRKAA